MSAMDVESRRVRVGVRIRPPTHDVEERRSPLSGDGGRVIASLDCGATVSYDFDNAFWPECGNEEVFERLAAPLLERALRGYNVCLFAYGQTGSGKTHSMTGREDDPGIISRFCDSLFEKIATRDGRYSVDLGYYEIYNEKIYDLLESAEPKTPLRVREHPVAGPKVQNLTLRRVDSFAAVERLTIEGNRRRATASTHRNERSSRSHAILELAISVESDGVSARSRVSLVDLAGSERVALGRVVGDRFKEGLSINRSLLTLGKVITCLSDSRKSGSFAPYRESVLTWLLKESFGKNSCTAMLAAVSPEATALEETLATLRYACKARRIVNKISINEDPQSKVIRGLKKEIEKLKCMRNNLDESLLDVGTVKFVDEVSRSNADRHATERRLQDELQKLTSELQAAEKRRDELENQKNIYVNNFTSNDISTYESDFYEVLQGILDDSAEELNLTESNVNERRNECLVHLCNIKESLEALQEFCSDETDNKQYKRILPHLLSMKKIHKEVYNELHSNSIS